jgi:hypothetical protein
MKWVVVSKEGKYLWYVVHYGPVWTDSEEQAALFSELEVARWYAEQFGRGATVRPYTPPLPFEREK